MNWVQYMYLSRVHFGSHHILSLSHEFTSGILYSRLKQAYSGKRREERLRKYPKMEARLK